MMSTAMGKTLFTTWRCKNKPALLFKSNQDTSSYRQDPEGAVHYYFELKVQQRQIQLKPCVEKCDGIQILPTKFMITEPITTMLDEGSYEYYIFKLPREKRAVFCGILQILSIDEVRHNLNDVGVDVTSIAQVHMAIQVSRTDMPLILVHLVNSAQNENIFNLTKLDHMLIKAESLFLDATDVRNSDIIKMIAAATQDE